MRSASSPPTVEASQARGSRLRLGLGPHPSNYGLPPCAPSARSIAYELARMRRLARVPKGYSSTVVSSKLSGDQMAHQARKGLPEPGDFRADSRHNDDDVGRGRMKLVDGGVHSGERGRGISLAHQLAANSFARNVLPTIQTLTAAGFVSQRALANELNRRRVPTARGGSWHYMTVRRVLLRLGLVAFGRTSRHAADARAEALEPTIRKLRKAGLSAQDYRARVERAKDTGRTRRQMAHHHRYPTAGAPEQARSRLEHQTPPLGPFFCPWN